jgi:hypothetical protein
MTVYATPHYIAVWTRAGTQETHQVVAADSYSASLLLHNAEGAPDELYFGSFTPAQLKTNDLQELKTFSDWHVKKDSNEQWTAVEDLPEAIRCAEDLNETP